MSFARMSVFCPCNGRHCREEGFVAVDARLLNFSEEEIALHSEGKLEGLRGAEFDATMGLFCHTLGHLEPAGRC